MFLESVLFHLPLVPECLLVVLSLRADWTSRFSFFCFSCCCPLLAAAVSCNPGLTAPPLSPQRGLPQGEHCEECGQQEVRLQLTAAQGLPPTLPAAWRHLWQGGDLTDPWREESTWGAGDQSGPSTRDLTLLQLWRRDWSLIWFLEANTRAPQIDH